MWSKSMKSRIACVVTIAYVMAFCPPTVLAQAPSVKLIVNPNKTDVTIGADPIALTAKASGANLKYKWSLQGPGKIDGEGAAVFYVLPDTVKGKSEQAVVTVTVTDDKNQETTDAFTFNILAKEDAAPAVKPATAPATAPAPETKEGMSTGMKIGLGVGAVALIGGVAAVAAGGGGGEDKKLDVTGTWRFAGQLTRDGCDLDAYTSIAGNFTFSQSGTTVTTGRVDLNVARGSSWYFYYRGTVSGKNVSMAARDPYVIRSGSSVFHFGSGLEMQNVKDKSGTGSMNLTGSIVGTTYSCQTIWSGTWTKQ